MLLAIKILQQQPNLHPPSRQLQPIHPNALHLSLTKIPPLQLQTKLNLQIKHRLQNNPILSMAIFM